MPATPRTLIGKVRERGWIVLGTEQPHYEKWNRKQRLTFYEGWELERAAKASIWLEQLEWIATREEAQHQCQTRS